MIANTHVTKFDIIFNLLLSCLFREAKLLFYKNKTFNSCSVILHVYAFSRCGVQNGNKTNKKGFAEENEKLVLQKHTGGTVYFCMEKVSVDVRRNVHN